MGNDTSPTMAGVVVIGAVVVLAILRKAFGGINVSASV